jgi:K+-sensing histidine kinase KdpD
MTKTIENLLSYVRMEQLTDEAQVEMVELAEIVDKMDQALNKNEIKNIFKWLECGYAFEVCSILANKIESMK